MSRTLYTVGHGNRSLEELVSTLAGAGVGRVADVRRYPGSRRHPHFAKDSLDAALGGRGISYQWWGEALGGRRRSAGPGTRHPAWSDPAFRAFADHLDTAEARQALTTLLESADAGPAVAVLCAETLWWRCHRRLIADAAVVRGTPVVHLLGPGRSQSHPLHPSLRVGADGWPVYDAGVDRSFPDQ